MRYILLVLFLVMSLHAEHLTKEQRYSKEILKLSFKQKTVMLKSYILGSNVDLGYTLTAIAWKESTFGKRVINLNDGINFKFKGSYGIYHNLLDSVCRRYNIKTQWSASRIAEKLVTDQDYAAIEAIKELMYWNRVWSSKGVSRVYSHMVASYNAGKYSLNCLAGREYAKDILLRIKVIKRYFRNYDIETILKEKYYAEI